MYQAILERDNKVLILLPKCASQYIRLHKPLKKYWKITNGVYKDEVYRLKEEGKEITAFIRHPLDRLVSAWSYFNNQADNYLNSNKMMWIRKMTFVDLVYKVCTTPDEMLDKHLASQYYHLTLENEFLPDKLIKWNFKELEKYLDAGELPKDKYNTSKRDPVWENYYTDISEQLTVDRYYTDIIMWES